MAGLTFLEARQLSLRHAQRIGEASPALAVATWGWEDDTHFQTFVDAKAALVDGDDLASLVDAFMLLVDKRTGLVIEVAWTRALELRETTEPVGMTPPD